MYLLQKLRLGCGRISNEAYINVRSESPSTFEFLVRASEYLCQKAFLDVLMPKDRAREPLHQVINNSL